MAWKQTVLISIFVKILNHAIPNVSKALNKQIEVEGFSSQYYLAMVYGPKP